MLIPPFDRPQPSRHYAYRRLISRGIGFWHRGSAWILGPLLVGLTAVGFASASEHAGEFNRRLFAAYPLAPLLVLPCGFALITWLTKRWFPGTQGSGIPQTIAAIEDMSMARRSDLLSIRIAVGKILAAIGGLAVGASIGREGPTVQIGASIMHVFHGRGPFRAAGHRRALILAGGAAGIAAAFNTPLAGIMFAIEELSKNHVFKANSSTLITVILSGLISLALIGNYTYFGTTGAYLEWQSSLLAILVCGIVGGAMGALFSRLLLSASNSLPEPLGSLARQRPLLFAAGCGLLLALLGMATGGVVFGTGYQPTRMTLEDSGSVAWYFGVGKLLATLLTSIAGLPGGIFAPSLAAGAGIGDNIASLMPWIAPHSAVVLLVMAAYLSGVTRAPITSFIIMMEMTDSHHMLLPLMSVSVIASAVSKLICPVPLYQALAGRFAGPAQARPGHAPEAEHR